MTPAADEVGSLVVIVTVDADREVMGDLLAHASYGLSVFGDFEGYGGGRLHLSEDGTRLVQYLRWRDRDTYERCRDDGRWADLESTKRFMAHVSAGRAVIDDRLYRVVPS